MTIIAFGALSDRLTVQLRRQGLKLPRKQADLLQRLADAVTLLHLHDVLPDSQVQRARGRILRKLSKVRWEAASEAAKGET